MLSYFQHVHVHVLPRRAGDFSRNDDVYKEVGAAFHFLFRVVFTVRKSPWWYRTCLEWNYLMISLHFYWLQKACDKHKALYWDFLVSCWSSCGHTGSQWRMQSTLLVLQFVTTQRDVASLPMSVLLFCLCWGKGQVRDNHSSNHTVSLPGRELPARGGKPLPPSRGKHRRLSTTSSQIAFWLAFCRTLLRLWTKRLCSPKDKN